MRILLVEDSPTDREILRYLLDAKFKGEVEFHEASTLESAFEILKAELVDCVVLDLQLPDSAGKETFLKLNKRFPNVPFIVMTHSKDRSLALEMIQKGAADFVIKSYEDEEEIFRRITFAVEKHRNSIRVAPDAARSYHNLERAKVNLQDAQDREDSPSTIRNMAVEVTSAVADLSRRMFTELQEINLRLTQQGTQQGIVIQTVNTLDKELLRGHSNRPSMRSQVDLLDHKIRALEGEIKGVEEAGAAYRRESVQLVQTKMSNKTKIIIAVITLLGVLGTTVGTYCATAPKVNKPAAPAPSASPK